MNEVVQEINYKRDRQVNLIIRIAKYKFGWGRKALFEFCLKHVEGLEKRMPEEALKNYSTTRLFAGMSRAEKSHIIQVLEKIERRNIENAER